MNEYIEQKPNIYMEIMDNFEAAKSSFYEEKNAKMHDVELPFEFIQSMKGKCWEINEKNLEEKITEFPNGKSLEDLFDINFIPKPFEMTLGSYQIWLNEEDEVLEIDVL